jgi:hypothetical protein
MNITEKPLATIERTSYGWKTSMDSLTMISAKIPNSEVWRTTLYLKTGENRWVAFESQISTSSEGALEVHKYYLNQYLYWGPTENA